MKKKFTKLTAALALLALFILPLTGWGQVVSGTTYSTLSTSSLPTGWSGSDGGGTSYIKLTASSHYIQTSEFGQNGFTSIKLKARKFGGPSDAQALITVSWYNNNTETVLGTIAPTNTTLTDYTISSPTNPTGNTTGYIKIQCKGASSSKGSGVSAVTITYTAAGGTPPTPTYTVTYNANGGTGTMTDPDSPYEANEDVTLLTNTFTAPEGKIWDSWLVKDASDNIIQVSNNSFTMPASNVTVTAQWVDDPNAPQYEWVLTDWTNLTSNDIFVIVGNETKAMANSTNNNNPSAIAVTIASGKITSDVTSNMMWNLSAVTDGYKLLPNGSTTTWLNNPSSTSLRIDDGTTNNTFTYVTYSSKNYLKVGDRYVCLYSNDWRAYTSSNVSSNATNTTFYKRQPVSNVASPEFSVAAGTYHENKTVEITCTTSGASIYYTTDGTAPTSESILYTQAVNVEGTMTLRAIATNGTENSNETSATYTLKPVNPTFNPGAGSYTSVQTVTINTTTEGASIQYKLGEGSWQNYTAALTVSENTTITAKATKTNWTDSEEVIATYYIELPLSTMQAIYDRATTIGNTAQNVNVTFGNWVVSGVGTGSANNLKTAYVTDNEGKGFIIFTENHSFAVNDKLSGTVIGTPLKSFSGAAEFTNLTTTTSGLTVSHDGEITVLSKTISELSGVNTGAVVTISGLNYDGTWLIDPTDNTQKIKPYSTLYAYGEAFESGKVYNVTGVYLQYGNTKEILPRNASDIVVNTIPVINANNIDIASDATSGNIEYTITNGTGMVSAAVTAGNDGNWLTLGTATDSKVPFTCVANTATTARTATITLSFSGAEDKEVIVTQAAYVTPVACSWVQASLADLTPADVFVIVGDNGDTYAMANNGGGQSNAPKAISVNVTGSSLSDEPNDNLKWNLVITNDGYIFYPAGSASTWLYCTNENNGLRMGDGSSPKVFTIKDNYLYNVGQARYVGIYNSSDWRSYTTINNNIKDQTFSFYKKVTDDVSYSKNIAAYTNTTEEPANGYVLIASPVASVTPTVDNGFLKNTYDLYAFDQSANGAEWRNYKANNFDLVSGKGYLYANSALTSLTFEGQPYNGNGVVVLSYDATATLAGWNLIGNPYASSANLDKPYYRLNSDGSALQTETESSAVAAMEGVFVEASAADQTATFTASSKGRNQSIATVNLMVSDSRGIINDNAIIRFDNGETLEKFVLNENSAKLYFTENDQDYAIVRSNNEDAMPVYFKAAENGTYTISVNTENLEANYLHLIDNITGMDVDLLANPSYSFEANTSDYTSRFRLVFSANNTAENNNDSFAFISNGQIIITGTTGNETIQVIDALGRILVSTNATQRVATENMTPGVYVVRIINGNDVKTQKIAVK